MISINNNYRNICKKNKKIQTKLLKKNKNKKKIQMKKETINKEKNFKKF